MSSDLVKNPIQETVDPRQYCQMPVAAVLMAVYAVEAAHRRELLSVGSLQTQTMLIPGCAFHRSATIGEVYIDDLVIQAMVHFFPIALEGLPNALIHCTNHWVWWSLRRYVGRRSNMRFGEVCWTESEESWVSAWGAEFH